jgi:hypothetical protein
MSHSVLIVSDSYLLNKATNIIKEKLYIEDIAILFFRGFSLKMVSGHLAVAEQDWSGSLDFTSLTRNELILTNLCNIINCVHHVIRREAERSPHI